MRIYKQLKYKGCPIIIKRTGRWTYEYLLFYKDKFYGTHIEDNLKWWEKWKVFLKEPRTAEQQNAMVHFLTKAAESTIETISKPKEKNG